MKWFISLWVAILVASSVWGAAPVGTTVTPLVESKFNRYTSSINSRLQYFSGGHTIQNSGSSLPTRAFMNFTGAVQATDSGGKTQIRVRPATTSVDGTMSAVDKRAVITTLIMVGDSLTYGYPDPTTSWVASLQTNYPAAYPITQMDIVNAGVGGNNSADILARLTTDVLNNRPDVVVLMCGTNSANSTSSPSHYETVGTFETNMRSIISQVRAMKRRLIIMVPPGVWEAAPGHIGTWAGLTNAALAPYQQKIRDLAQELSIDLIDNSGLAQNSTNYQNDGTHLTPTGYAAIYANLDPTLSQVLNYAGKSVIQPKRILASDSNYQMVPTSQIQVVSDAADGTRGIYIDTYGANTNAARQYFRKGRGTMAAPTIIGNGDDVGTIGVWGYDGAAFQGGGTLKFSIDASPSAGSTPMAFKIQTGANVSGLTEALHITSGQLVGIGDFSPAGVNRNPTEKLEVLGNIQITGTGKGIKFPDGTSILSTSSLSVPTVADPGGSYAYPVLTNFGATVWQQVPGTSFRWNGATSTLESPNFTGALAASNVTQDATHRFISDTTAGYVYFGTTTGATSDSGFFWDNTNKRLGVGTTSPQNLVHFAMSGFPALRAERTSTSDTNNIVPVTTFLHTTTQDMTDGFGTAIAFSATDSGASAQQLGQIGAVRAGADNTGDIVIRPSVAGTGTEKLRVTSTGHYIATGTAPTLSSCGTSPTISGNDVAGKFTIGTTGTGCTLTFANAYTNAPACVVTGGAAVTDTTSTTALTVTAVPGTYSYVCMGI